VTPQPSLDLPRSFIAASENLGKRCLSRHPSKEPSSDYEYPGAPKRQRRTIRSDLRNTYHIARAVASKIRCK
jgi:hypothetical protein